MDKQYPRLYRIWSGMIQRCKNPKRNRYKYYGGKGIKVCDRWLKYENFAIDMKAEYIHHYCKNKGDTTIDRINKEIGYDKQNCKWATAAEQVRNRRNTRFIEHNGVILCLTDWSKIFEIPLTTLWDNIVKKDMTIEDYLEFRKTTFGTQKLPTEDELVEIMPVPDPFKMVKLPGKILVNTDEETQNYTMNEYPRSVAKAILNKLTKT